jgi:hypothetical protein
VLQTVKPMESPEGKIVGIVYAELHDTHRAAFLFLEGKL